MTHAAAATMPAAWSRQLPHPPSHTQTEAAASASSASAAASSSSAAAASSAVAAPRRAEDVDPTKPLRMMVLEVASVGSLLHVYGVTGGGVSVRAEVSNFWPFLYCLPTVTCADGSRRAVRQSDLPVLRRMLEEELQSSRAAKTLAKNAPPTATAASASASTPKKAAASAAAASKKRASPASAASSFFGGAAKGAGGSKSKPVELDDDDDDEAGGGGGGDGDEEDDFVEEDAEEEETGSGGPGGARSCVVAIKLVQKRSLMYYRGNDLSTFVQVWLSSPTLLTPAHQILSKRMPSQSAASVGFAASAAAAAAAAAEEHVRVCGACTLEQGAERKTCAACDTPLTAAPVKRAAAAASAAPSAAADGSGGDGDAAVSFSASGELFGTNIEHYLRFMVASEIVGGGWANLRAGRFELVPAAAKATRCAVELRVKWSPPGEEIPVAEQAIHGTGSAASSAAAAEDVSTAALAPLRVLSFDVQIRCPSGGGSGGGATPRPEKDPIIAIANEAVWYPAQAGVAPVKVLFLVRSAVGPGVPHAFGDAAAPASGCPAVVWCDSEADLLLRWRDFFLRVDADVVTGYDLAERDVPYLLARAAAHEAGGGGDHDHAAGEGAARTAAVGATLSPPPASKRTKRASPASSSASSAAAASPLPASACTASARDFSDWPILGRDGRTRSTLQSIQTYTAGWVRAKKRMTATSNQASAYLKMEGRLFFDVQRVVQTTHSLRTYSLQECAQEFLGRTEEYLDETVLHRLLQRAREGVPAADLPAAAAAAAAVTGSSAYAAAAAAGAPSPALGRQSSAAFRLALDQSARPAAAAPGKKLTAKDRKRRREIEYEAEGPAAAAEAAATPSPPPVACASSASAAGAAAAGYAVAATPAPVVAPAPFNSPLACFTRFASYAARQAQLPLLLLDALMIVVQSVELARTTGINVRDVWTRGQMIRTWSLLLRHCASSPESYIVPSQRDNSQAQGMTSGPWIFDCTVLGTTGLHADPVATLDFASLYPSIMIAHNLCYSTIVVREDEDLIVPNDDTVLTPIRRRFVRAHVRRGVVPMILEGLLTARKAVRAQIPAARRSDPFLAGVLNERQKALKISANATYGFTGSSASRLMLVELAEATINYGSKLLQQSAAWVAERFGKGTPADTSAGSGSAAGSAAGGGGGGCRVIYGDTDSLMILMPGRTVRSAMLLAREISASITASLPPPMQFAFEKVYQPFLLQQNKKYAGVMYTADAPEQGKGVLDVKGMESVRRDIIPLVRRLMEELLGHILVERDLARAVSATKRCISDLLGDRFTLHDLLITKALWRGTDAGAYGAKLAHIELAEKLRRRYPGREIALGQRVSYVLTQGEKGVKQWQQSEEPGWVEEKALPLDLELYVANFLQKPLVRLFALPGLMGSADRATKALFTGEHMRAVKRGAPPAEKGLGAFFKREAGARCAHCKRPITSSNSNSNAAAGAAGASPSKASATVASSPFAAAAAATKKGFSRVGAKPAAASSSSSSKAAPTPSAASAAAASSALPSHGLCGDCERNMDKVVTARVEEYANREAKMASLAMQCHRCQSGGGSNLREILCVNEDCAIYWDRKKTWRGVQQSHQLLLQLDW